MNPNIPSIKYHQVSLLYDILERLTISKVWLGYTVPQTKVYICKLDEGSYNCAISTLLLNGYLTDIRFDIKGYFDITAELVVKDIQEKTNQSTWQTNLADIKNWSIDFKHNQYELSLYV